MARLTAGVFIASCSAVVATGAAAFDCAPVKCPEITSCAEARYKLYACGHGERDADNDGIPCESICGGDVATFEARSLAGWPNGMPFIAMPKQPGSFEIAPPAQAEQIPPQGLVCGSKRKCGQMDSCAEAQFYLRSCGVSSLDRDGDGTACNSLCGGR